MNVKETKYPGFEQDCISTKEGKNLIITFIKHGSLLFEYDNQKIYLDPVAEYADYSNLPKADLILITHEHYDHFDKKGIETVEKNDTEFISNKVVFEQLGRGRSLSNNEQTTALKNINIKATPAYNITEGRDIFHPKGRDNGYVLTFGSTRVYIGGDSEVIPEMKEQKNIDIAFLAANQPYTMTVPQAIEAAKMINPKILYPYHYGDTNVQEIADGLKESDIDVRIRNL